MCKFIQKSETLHKHILHMCAVVRPSFKNDWLGAFL